MKDSLPKAAKHTIAHDMKDSLPKAAEHTIAHDMKDPPIPNQSKRLGNT